MRRGAAARSCRGSAGEWVDGGERRGPPFASQASSTWAPPATSKHAFRLNPKVLLVYHERLGDIARCLPLARHFAAQGKDVFFECKPEYHGLFSLVSYAVPVAPGVPRETFSEVCRLQIWPERFAHFEARGLNWMDYIYEPWPGCDREIVFDRHPALARPVPDWVKQACLVFPNGYSQRNAPDPRKTVLLAHGLFPAVPVCVIGKRDLGCHELGSIPELTAWIAAAKHVLAVNTAASILCSAVRPSWHHIPDLDLRHDWTHPRRIVVNRN